MTTKLMAFAFLLFIFSSVAHGQAKRDSAIELYRTGEYAKAIAILEKIRYSTDADYTTALYLAAAYVHAGNSQKARATFEHLNDFKPRNVPHLDKEAKITRKPSIAGGYGRGQIPNGSVKVAVELGTDGKVGFAFPFSATSVLLFERAVASARSIEFEPAELKGKPVTTIKIIEYSFSTY